MELFTFQDVPAFSAAVAPFLARHEAENNLMLGIIDFGIKNPAAAADWEMAAVMDGGESVLAALRTPPQNLIVAGEGAEADALALLAAHYAGKPLPGVIGPSALAQAFAARYAGENGFKWKVTMAETVYRLTAAADVPQPGTLRPAGERDRFFLAYWLRASDEEIFHREAALDFERAAERMAAGDLYLYEVDGMPVCMAGTSRQMPHGRSIGPVYTPPIFRRKGYATAAAAALSRVILERGNEYAALFADASNPASNRAYQKAGFVAVDEVAEIGFLPGTDEV